MAALKPCPFCDSSAKEPEVRVTSELDDPEQYYACCPACGASGPESLTEAGAALTWNSRPREAH